MKLSRSRGLILTFIASSLILVTLTPCFAGGKEDFKEAKELWNMTKLSDASELFNKAILSGKLNMEELVEAHYNRAIFFFFYKPDQVMSEINIVINYKPDYSAAYALRADAWVILSEDNKALADWEKALKINPDESVVYNNRSIFFENKGELEKAINDLDKYLKLESQDSARKKDIERLKALYRTPKK